MPINYLVTFAYNYASAELATKVAEIDWNSALLDTWLYAEMTHESNEAMNARIHRLFQREYKESIPSRVELEAHLEKIKKETKEAENERPHSQEIQE